MPWCPIVGAFDAAIVDAGAAVVCDVVGGGNSAAIVDANGAFAVVVGCAVDTVVVVVVVAAVDVANCVGDTRFVDLVGAMVPDAQFPINIRNLHVNIF